MSVGAPKLMESTGNTSVSKAAPKLWKSAVVKPLAGLAVSATTIARLVIATTRPSRMLGFEHAELALVLNLTMSPTAGMATDMLNRPAPSFIGLLAHGMR